MVLNCQKFCHLFTNGLLLQLENDTVWRTVACTATTLHVLQYMWVVGPPLSVREQEMRVAEEKFIVRILTLRASAIIALM